MKKITLITFALFILAGCASGDYYWQHPIKGPSAYEQDAETCNTEGQRARRQAAEEVTDASYAETAKENAYDRAFESCMEANGWKKVKE